MDRRVFVDSAAYFALTDSHDGNHAEAAVIRDRLIAERWRLVTTNFILAGTHALILARMNREIAARVQFSIDRSATTIIRVSPADEHRARWIIATYGDKDFSLTDAASFAVMERLDTAMVFTFDRHFAQYGLTGLTA